MEGDEQAPYKDVRSLIRGLRIIEALRDKGWTKIGALSAAADVERSSAYRIVNTLVQLGYIARRSEDGAVALTPKFADFGHAIREDDIVTQLAWPYLCELTKEVLWPCDFASFEGGKVLIRLSTHKISPMSIHRGMIGKERSLVRSALGMAMLSAMPADEMEAVLAIVQALGGINAQDVIDRRLIYQRLEAIRQQGYASSTGQIESSISAIALPVLWPGSKVAGAINVVFFRKAMSTELAAERYLSKLANCVGKVEQALHDYAERTSLAIERSVETASSGEHSHSNT